MNGTTEHPIFYWHDSPGNRFRVDVGDADEAAECAHCVPVYSAETVDRLRARVAELEAADGICFTAMLVEIDGHAYGLRPGAARIVREALRKWGMIPLLLNALQVARDNIDPDLEPDDIALIDAAIDAAKDGA